MARKSLASTVADGILDAVVAGEFAAGLALPSEAEIGEQYDVSRVTVREALKTLQAQNVVRVLPGRGTFVNPVTAWTDLGPVLRATTQGADAAASSLQLVEVRRMIETGAAALAATRRTEADVASLESQLDRMRSAHDSADLDEFVEADIAFHDVILHAAGNVFVGVLFEPLGRVMRAKREQTSAVEQIRVNAIAEHAAIVDAVRSGDAERSRLAMDSHMTQTANDLERFVLGEI
ncbi:FadR/GntR family transcriptional regulator [Marisediminicola sp. LYQ134]|uniref:FadR/GntR family transcriptional regulator n=1 Tax=Marisediminicola sp. LYQ134 TaxID=3391061 RepID=UPI0039831CBB